jgi:hypothetical protein
MSLSYTPMTTNTQFAFVDMLDDELDILSKRIPPLPPSVISIPAQPNTVSNNHQVADVCGVVYIGQLTVLGLWVLYSLIGWKR